MMTNTKNLTLSAMFLALGIVLPMFIGQVPKLGSMLLPMHIPVFLCAYICGPKHGAVVGFVLPLLRTMLFGVPNLYPEAVAIAAEMTAYALVSGLIYAAFKRSAFGLYASLVSAMVLGRIVRCAVQLALLSIVGKAFVFDMFFSAVIIAGIPGIVLQLIFIPAVIFTAKRFKTNGSHDAI